jgi:hypothetical protein
VIRLRIFPAPTPDEAAAIGAAIKTLVASHAVRAGLRYNDVAASVGPSAATQPLAATARPLCWRDAARLEPLEPGV